EACLDDWGGLVGAQVRGAGPAGLAAELDGMGRGVQRLGRRGWGALLERVVAVRAPAPAARPPCPACGGLLRLGERARERHVPGLTGDGTGRCAGRPMSAPARSAGRATRRWMTRWGWARPR